MPTPSPSDTYCLMTSESIAVSTMSGASPASTKAASMWLRPVKPTS